MCSLAFNTALLYSSFVMFDISSLGPKRRVYNFIEPVGSLGLKFVDTEIKLSNQKMSSLTLIWNVKPRRKAMGKKKTAYSRNYIMHPRY